MWDFLTVLYMDETLIHIYDPETKEQSKEWRHSGSPRPKKFWWLTFGTKMEFACILPGKGCNHHGKVLCCTSRQIEVATGLQTSRRAFERNIVSSRQCSSSQGGHYAPEIGRSSL
jgi:hypothetical protein